MADHYRALTRAYRPRQFDEIVGQDHVSHTLQNAIKKNRLSHAYMFCGPRGVGKTTMARVLARKVNEIGENVDGESLNQTLNVIEIDAASNNGVDDVRDLRERVRIPPQNGRYKIYIIDEVHMLSKSAFNALLKTLEEPPDHAIFIFATTEPNKVLPTILSRVQRFDFKRISINQIIDSLKEVAAQENIKIDVESLHVIAKKADGALRDALGLLDQAIAFCGTDIKHDDLLQALNVVSVDRMFEFMEAVEQRDAAGGLSLIDKLLHEGYDIQEFLTGLTEHLRNLYIAHHSKKMHLVEATKGTKQKYKQAAKSFDEDDLMRMLYLVNEAQFKVKEAQQPKIQFEITLLKLVHMERRKRLDALLGELKELKKKQNKPVADQNLSEPQDNGSTQVEEKTNEANGSTETTQTEQNEPDEFSAVAEHAVNEANGAAEEEQTPENNFTNDHHAIFGQPSLGNAATKVDTKQQSTKEKPFQPAAQNRNKNIKLDDIKENWEAYVNQLKKHVPQMLYFQMQRVEPFKLKNRELFLRCNDDFAKKMVDEHQKELAKILEGVVGSFLRFSCKVRQKETDDKTSMSPYERFKKLQKNDPTIKKLVELFGAELDYNL